MTGIALIGGTGLNQLAGLELQTEHVVNTPWGAPSHAVAEGRYHDKPLFFLARHGVPHHIAPDRINYRANLWALRELGVSTGVAVNAVGGISEPMRAGRLLVPDQLIDYTWGREHSYFSGTDLPLQHIDFTQPYSAALRQQLLVAANAASIDVVDGGTYGVTQGPRLETAAEVTRLGRDGCDVVGMTGMPEAALAAELELAYAAICLVVNPAAGLGSEPITEASMRHILEREMQRLGDWLRVWLQGR